MASAGTAGAPRPAREPPDRSRAWGHRRDERRRQIAIGTLVARFPALRLATPAAELTWKPALLIHGLVALPAALR